MKRLFAFTLFVLFLYSFSLSAAVKARVTGHRLNVRARPDINAEIVTQLRLDDTAEVLEKGEEWTKIKAPADSSCWVFSEYVTKGRINTDSVNLRSGPGLAFPVLCCLYQGTPVGIMEVAGEWSRIQPPVEFGVWVSSRYLSYRDKEEKEEPPEKSAKGSKASRLEKQIEEQPLPPAEQAVEKIGALPAQVKPAVSLPESEIKELELVSYAGYLDDLGMIINRPGTYKLTDGEEWVCILTSPVIELNPYVNRQVRIEGIIVSQTTSWGIPVVEVKRLQVIK